MQICKTVERIAKSAILDHLSTNKLLNPYQHGLFHSLSCLTNLLRFFGNVSLAYDKKQHTYATFLDLSKAFDVV